MRWMVLILGLLLSGCYAHYQTSYQGPPPLQTTSLAQVDAMVGNQQPAAYKVGFMEGCDSGRLSAGNNSFLFKKDTDRFETDDVYKQGWNDGFNRCLSGDGAPASGYTYYQSSYGYYYPGTFYSGFYYPAHYYSPGFSIWTGYYGFPRYRYWPRRAYYYSPWYGGHRHKARRGYRGYAGGRYNIAKPPPSRRNHGGGGHRGGIGGGGGRKGGGGSKGRGGGGRYWIR